MAAERDAAATGDESIADHEELAAIVSYARTLLAWTVEAGWRSGLVTRSDAILSTVPEARDVERLISQARSLPPVVATDAAAAASLAAQAPSAAAARRLSALVRRIGGAPLDRDLLALAVAVELDPIARALAGYLHGGTSGPVLDVASAMLAFGQGRIGGLLAALAPGAPLLRNRLLELHEPAGVAHAAATVRAAPRLVRWVTSPRDIDPEVAALATVVLPDRTSPLGAAALAPLRALVDETVSFLSLAADAAPRADLVLRGARGTGRGEIAREACRRLGVPLFAADVETLLAARYPGDAAAALLREVELSGAQLVLAGAELFAADNEPAQRLRAVLAGARRPVLLTAREIDRQHAALGRPLLVRDVPIAATDEREALWREVLPEVDAEHVGSLYRVGVGAILRIAEAARLQARLRGAARCTTDDVARAVQSEFASDLGTVATRVAVSQTWDDLVASDDTHHTVAELINQLRHRSTVLGRWGFSRKLGKGLGTVALFTGEPGTGKSMVAGLIASTLGLELYQVDLSRVVSKWVGETEKNLGKLFDAAETGHVLLLFDEADALFGRRAADPKAGGERDSNLEVNYILQRLESFHGVAILTSNLGSAIDPAFSRRLSFELRFTFPDPEQRAAIWRRVLPDELPREEDIDFAELAQRFELSGGYIRNIALRAAYLATFDGARVGMRHLLEAAEYEYRDRGMLVAQGRIK